MLRVLVVRLVFDNQPIFNFDKKNDKNIMSGMKIYGKN